MTVTRKLLIPVLAFFAVVLMALIGAFILDSGVTLQRQEEKDLEELHQVFLDKVDALESLALALATNVANDPDTQAAFAAGDRELLIELALPAYQALDTRFDVPQHEFHVPLAKSFLRLHQLDEFGDDLSGYRSTVVDANLDHRPVSGLEIGRAGLGVRGIVPVSYQGTHIGTVEFGLDAGRELLDELKEQSGADWRLLLSRRVAEIVLFDPSVKVVPFEGIGALEPGPTDDLLLQAGTLDTPIFAPEGIYPQVLRGKTVISRISAGDREYTILSTPLLDFHKDVIGVVEIVSDRTAVIAAQQRRAAIGSIAALAALIAGGAGLIFITTRTLRPISILTETATAIARGDLSHTAPIESRDEIGLLARTFNDMTEQLRELIGGLEQRVAERTRELETTAADLSTRSADLETANLRMAEINQQLEQAIHQSRRRAALLQASMEVSHAAAQVRELDQLLPQVTQLVSQHFGFYHAGIFLLDETGQYAILRAANSKGGQHMLAREHKLAVGSEGMVGYVTASGQPRIALDVGADAVHFDTPELPNTRSEMAVPLKIGDETIGALDVQSTEEAAFGPEDVTALTALADQIAIAIESARLFRQTQQAVARAEAAQQRYLQQAWSHYLRQETAPSAYEYTVSGVAPAGDVPLPEIELALKQRKPVTVDKADHPLAHTALAMPITFRGEVIGALGLHETETGREWSEDEIALIQDVAEQIGLALENARLVEETERRAQREALISQITTQIRQRPDVDGIMQTAVRELGKALGTRRAFVQLTSSFEPASPPRAAPAGGSSTEVSDDGN